MSSKRKILCFMGVVLAVTVALALGAAWSSIALVGVSLLCPAAMYFGMHSNGVGGNFGHCDKRNQPDSNPPEHAEKFLDTKAA